MVGRLALGWSLFFTCVLVSWFCVSPGDCYFLQTSKYNVTWPYQSMYSTALSTLFEVGNTSLSITQAGITELHFKDDSVWTFINSPVLLEKIKSDVVLVSPIDFSELKTNTSIIDNPTTQEITVMGTLHTSNMNYSYATNYSFPTTKPVTVPVGHTEPECADSRKEAVQMNCSCQAHYEIGQGSAEYTYISTGLVPTPFNTSYPSPSRGFLSRVYYTTQMSLTDLILEPTYDICNIGGFLFKLPQFGVLINFQRTAQIGNDTVEVLYAIDVDGIYQVGDLVSIPIVYLMRWDKDYEPDSIVRYDPDVTFLFPKSGSTSNNDNNSNNNRGNGVNIAAIVVPIVVVAAVVFVVLIVVLVGALLMYLRNTHGLSVGTSSRRKLDEAI